MYALLYNGMLYKRLPVDEDSMYAWLLVFTNCKTYSIPCRNVAKHIKR